MAEIPERFLERWRLVGRFGGGGQAHTYEVLHHETNQRGVLKVPKSLTEVAAARFCREVEILTQIEHPAIVRLLDHCVEAGSLGYVSPLGEPLVAFWDRTVDGLSPHDRYDTAYRIARDLAEGLSVLHSRGVVHRDIKPANVIMLSDGDVLRPVLIDFGLAIRPEDERLSPIDGRAVANVFAAPPAAYYGNQEPLPAWDCLGLAWLFGWFLGREPKAWRFHWRFHEMMDEPRRDRVRALLAASQNEGMVPQDAGAFIALMEQLRLDGRPPLTVTAPNVAGAAMVWNEARAESIVQRAHDDERVDASMAILSDFIEDVRQQVRDGFESGGISQHLPFAMSDERTPVRELMKSARRNISAVLINCAYGDERASFSLTIHIRYERAAAPDELPFPLWVESIVSVGQMCGENQKFIPGTDGAYRREGVDQPVAPSNVAGVMFEFMASEKHWKLVGDAQRYRIP